MPTRRHLGNYRSFLRVRFIIIRTCTRESNNRRCVSIEIPRVGRRSCSCRGFSKNQFHASAFHRHAATVIQPGTQWNTGSLFFLNAPMEIESHVLARSCPPADRQVHSFPICTRRYGHKKEKEIKGTCAPAVSACSRDRIRPSTMAGTGSTRSNPRSPFHDKFVTRLGRARLRVIVK